MSVAILLALGLTAQVPSLQYRNTPGDGQRITIHTWCEAHGEWANNAQAVVLRPGQSSRLNLHPGYFVVVARNQFGIEHRLRRVLAPGEVDRLVMVPIVGTPPGPSPPPLDFAIVEDVPKEPESAID